MKRIAGWLRKVADEIDPPAKPKRGRSSKRAEKNAAAVDSLFTQGEAMHGWPQEP